ncbi:MAG: TonB-dependent receptor [Saprospiraceae bacterium]|nr:TonB-dependent receptor [Saprospiraceae bacterium]
MLKSNFPFLVIAFFLTFSNSLLAQQHASTLLTGVIVNEQDKALQDVYITVDDAYTLQTDNDGRFQFKNNNNVEKLSLKISHLGYENIDTVITARNSNEIKLILIEKSYQLKAVELMGNWASDKTPIAKSILKKDEITRLNNSQDVPYLLQNLPSVVVTSDAGTGIGYTGIRIRGSDASRVNVTINGIPLNDPESQQVYWVDLPDILSSTDDIQVQRGVGLSSAGVGSFGGSVNLSTNQFKTKSAVILDNSIGNYATLRNSVQFNSGLIKQHFSIDGRISRTQSDGYIDRSKSLLKSYFVSAAYINNDLSIRFNHFYGNEQTYQAWYGVPVQFIDTLPTYNPAGQEKSDSPYKNEIDNYTQQHFQLFLNKKINTAFSLQSAIFYTKGSGYYEQYKANKDLYNIVPIPIFMDLKGGIISDLVQRRWLKNDFLGVNINLSHNTEKSKLNIIVSANTYLGKHFGEIIWTEKVQNLPSSLYYYNDDARKNDLSTSLIWQYNLNQSTTLLFDLQARRFDYKFLGLNDSLGYNNQLINKFFINPKIGMMKKLNEYNRCFLSLAIANHEPNRDDFVYSTASTRPKNEKMYDVELGYNFTKGKFSINANYYMMYYKDQLVLTGKINDVGEYIRTNVDNSYRTGVEVQGGVSLTKKIRLNASATLSQNRISDYLEYIDNWDNGTQEIRSLKSSALAFSPSIIQQFRVSYNPLKNMQIDLSHRLVGKQYLDNAESESASLPAYFVFDAVGSYKFKVKKYGDVLLTMSVLNIANQHYISNGWSYRFRSEGYNPLPDDPNSLRETNSPYYLLKGLFPQAGTQFLLSLKIKLASNKS